MRLFLSRQAARLIPQDLLGRFPFSNFTTTKSRKPGSVEERADTLALASTKEIDIFALHSLPGVPLCFRGQFDQICSYSISSLSAF